MVTGQEVSACVGSGRKEGGTIHLSKRVGLETVCSFFHDQMMGPEQRKYSPIQREELGRMFQYWWSHSFVYSFGYSMLLAPLSNAFLHCSSPISTPHESVVNFKKQSQIQWVVDFVNKEEVFAAFKNEKGI